MNVPFFDLSGQHQTLRPEIDAAGGMVVTDNPESADKLKRVRVLGAQTR